MSKGEGPTLTTHEPERQWEMLLHEPAIPVRPVVYFVIGRDLACSVEAICKRNLGAVAGGEALDSQIV